jgi:hypothetical protein
LVKEHCSRKFPDTLKGNGIFRTIMQSPAPPSPISPTRDQQQQQQQSQSNLDFDHLLEKQRELLKQIRSSPDQKKKDLVEIHLPGSPAKGEDQKPSPPGEWGWSFERIPSKSIATEAELSDAVAEEAASGCKKTKKQRRHERQQAEEWISDWNFERITSSSKPAAAAVAASSSPAPAAFNEDDSTSCPTQEWYFERIPPSAQGKPHDVDEDSVMEMIMEQHHDDFAALEAAVHGADDISLEDLVVDGDEDDDDDDDDVIMGVDGDEGLLPRQIHSLGEPQYMQELKHRQYAATYMDELKHRQAEGPAVPHGLYNQRQEMPPAPSYTAELKTVTKPVLTGSSAVDEDGDASMTGGDRSMATPDTSNHTPKVIVEGFGSGSGSSPTSVMDGPRVPALSQGFPRPGNLSATSSGSASIQLPCAEGMDDLFTNTLQKLTQSMKRSAESRRSLKIKTEHTQEYERNLCVHQILQSVESSSRQVDTCLQMYRPRGDGFVDGTPDAASS